MGGMEGGKEGLRERDTYGRREKGREDNPCECNGAIGKGRKRKR